MTFYYDKSNVCDNLLKRLHLTSCGIVVTVVILIYKMVVVNESKVLKIQVKRIVNLYYIGPDCFIIRVLVQVKVRIA